MSLAEGGPVARIGESGEFLELEYQVNGQVFKDSLPLYRAGGVRYFSAGIGIDERVAVTIQSAKGGPSINIPRDHVNGPWLFVELPSGTYHLTAIHADRTQGLKGVTVEAGKMNTVHLRWPEDRGSVAPSGEAIGQ
jgi:hypothetical protein